MIDAVYGWSAVDGPVTVTVSTTTFEYSVSVAGVAWLTDGTVAFQCGGQKYSSRNGNLTGGPISELNGTDTMLGGYSSIQRTWAALNCSSITTSVRQYKTGIEFVTTVSTQGAQGTATEAKLVVAGNRPSTEFPNFALPNGSAAPGLLTWNGNSLRGMTQLLRQPANMQLWSGGLEGGPLVFYSELPADNTTVAAVLAPSTMFKTAITSRVGNRLTAGVQGMITELPPNYSVRFALVSTAQGITASMMRYGALLAKAHATRSTKLTLADDPLSRQLHAVNDGGSLLNYCDYWPQCVGSSSKQFPDGPSSCTPMAFTLKKASEYHKSLGLNVSL